MATGPSAHRPAARLVFLPGALYVTGRPAGVLAALRRLTDTLEGSLPTGTRLTLGALLTPPPDPRHSA